MGLKGHGHSLGPARSCPPHDLAQHMRVRPVDSIEVTHAHQRRPKSRWNVLEFVEDLHFKSSGQWPVFGKASVRKVFTDH